MTTTDQYKMEAFRLLQWFAIDVIERMTKRHTRWETDKVSVHVNTDLGTWEAYTILNLKVMKFSAEETWKFIEAVFAEDDMKVEMLELKFERKVKNVRGSLMCYDPPVHQFKVKFYPAKPINQSVLVDYD